MTAPAWIKSTLTAAGLTVGVLLVVIAFVAFWLTIGNIL